jgi:hypothetical protein
MQLMFADTAVQRLCATQELLIRVFGELWALVKICLSMLEAVETLADLATFAAVSIRSVCQISEGIVDFLIGFGAIQFTVRALGQHSSSGTPDDDRDHLARVHSVSVVGVSRVVTAMAEA